MDAYAEAITLGLLAVWMGFVWLVHRCGKGRCGMDNKRKEG